MKNICQKVCRAIIKLLFRSIFIAVIGVPPFLLFKYPFNDATAWATYYLALITGGVIWWQGRLLKKQLELQTITDLDKEWSSCKMREIRANSFNENPDDLDKIELVLEFLEKIASYRNKSILQQKTLWDYFGWHIIRYYYYNQENIIKIRRKWSNDETLYCELQKLYPELIRQEAKEIENHLKEQKDNFIKSEKYEVPKKEKTSA